MFFMFLFPGQSNECLVFNAIAGIYQENLILPAWVAHKKYNTLVVNVSCGGAACLLGLLDCRPKWISVYLDPVLGGISYR